MGQPNIYPIKFYIHISRRLKQISGKALSQTYINVNLIIIDNNWRHRYVFFWIDKLLAICILLYLYQFLLRAVVWIYVLDFMLFSASKRRTYIAYFTEYWISGGKIEWFCPDIWCFLKFQIGSHKSCTDQNQTTYYEWYWHHRKHCE